MLGGTNSIGMALDQLFPVGAIYIGTMSTCPLQALGIGTWTLKASDMVLQGAGSVGTVGSTIAAGAPNITATGTIGTIGSHAAPTISGAFTNLRNGSVGSDEPNTTGWLYDLDASLSSSVYGNSNTIQPPAYVVNIWERTA